LNRLALDEPTATPNHPLDLMSPYALQHF
jgi:hypothetical protein